MRFLTLLLRLLVTRKGTAEMTPIQPDDIRVEEECLSLRVVFGGIITVTSLS